MKNNFWNENVEQWVQVIDSMGIDSRKITNPAIIQAISDNKLKSVLDVGCGEGWLARSLPEDIQYTGIDGSEGLIKKAQERSGHLFEAVSYDDLKSKNWRPNALVEGVVFNFSLLDEDISSTLKSVSEFLLPEGKIIIQTIHPCFKLPTYQDGWFIEDFKTMSVDFKDVMPWYGRTLSSWISEFEKSDLRLCQLIEPRGEGLPTSIIFILKSVK
ncbi:class I SAM-dependent methyltransferase [Pseudobdellovibrio exovorus]|uniref:Methyltransferase domain-containing protein n=1 Tax=Pseudobdellovibrio exovorus JSS TaxID=1184267 RepID=M4V8T3_9BACT|nr:class I SAM-dependent methyltransferase [Pseudobdellovibrio exovorus]AGH95817.1 hypothetical protein A11Q_1601 [Pseudobdellovibrio exovorus JSS]